MATYNFNTSTPNGVMDRSTQRSLLSKSFTYMFYFLLLTFAVGLGLSALFKYTSMTPETYTGIMIGASLTQIVLTVIIAFSSLRGGKASVIPFSLYAICMGVMISGFSFFFEWWELASVFAISALCFGSMALIGAHSKNASGMGMVGFGLLFGVMMVSLFNIFIVLFASSLWTPMMCATSIIIVIAIMLITAYDVYNIKQISMRCDGNSNLAFYLAFNLYLDFIMIFIHLLRLLAIFSNNRR